jgi:hypothetical protein
MNGRDTRTSETLPPLSTADSGLDGTDTRLDRPDHRISPTGTRGSTATGTFAEGEETLPDRDAEERVHHRGSFATGQEVNPEENAERRLHARGGFAVGEETTPEEDAEERSHPGTFADTEPSI